MKTALEGRKKDTEHRNNKDKSRRLVKWQLAPLNRHTSPFEQQPAPELAPPPMAMAARLQPQPRARLPGGVWKAAAAGVAVAPLDVTLGPTGREVGPGNMRVPLLGLAPWRTSARHPPLRPEIVARYVNGLARLPRSSEA